MSTGLNCLMIEVQPREWYLVLEDGSAPKQSWDWREFATAYGPFATEDETDDFLRHHFANPGGTDTRPYAPNAEPDPVLVKLLTHAVANRDRQDRGRRW